MVVQCQLKKMFLRAVVARFAPLRPVQRASGTLAAGLAKHVDGMFSKHDSLVAQLAKVSLLWRLLAPEPEFHPSFVLHWQGGDTTKVNEQLAELVPLLPAARAFANARSELAELVKLSTDSDKDLAEMAAGDLPCVPPFAAMLACVQYHVFVFVCVCVLCSFWLCRYLSIN